MEDITPKPKFRPLVETLEKRPPAKAVVKAAPVVPSPPAPASPKFTFDRYFNLLGRPARHKAGMLAYKNTKGKKTQEAWDALFKSY